MTNLSKHLKFILISAVLFLGICLMTGCGPEIDTTLYLNNNHKGTREITVEFPKSALKDFENDKIIINNILKEFTPAEMTHDFKVSGNNMKFTFEIKFDDTDEYENKVESILKKSSSNIKPEIYIDAAANEFRSGIEIHENFNSYDLLMWLYPALEERGLIEEGKDYSKWVKLRSTQIIYNHTTYIAPHTIDIDELLDHGLERISIITYFLTDGTYERKVNFSISPENEEFLQKSNNSLFSILNARLPKNAEIGTFDGENVTVYVKFKGKDTAEIVNATNKLLQTNNTVFNVNTRPSALGYGIIEIDIDDYCDTKYYLTSDKKDSYEVYYRFSKAIQTSGEFISYYNEKDEMFFMNNIRTDKHIISQFDTPILFNKADIILKGDNKLSAELIFTKNNKDKNIYSDKAFKALEETVKAVNRKYHDSCTIKSRTKKDCSVYTVKFKKDKAEKLSEILVYFTKCYAGMDKMFRLELTESDSDNIFAEKYDLKIRGDMSVFTVEENKLKIQPSFLAIISGNEDNIKANSYITADKSNIHVDLSIMRPSIFTRILLIIFYAVIIAGIVLLIIFLIKKFGPKRYKTLKPAKPKKAIKDKKDDNMIIKI